MFEHWEDLFKQNTEEYCMLSTVGRFIYTNYRGIMYVEHCGKTYLHKILRNTIRWTLWEDLFTQNTEEYCMLSTMGRFIYTTYWGLLYVEHWEDLFTQNTEEYCMLNTVGRFIYTIYRGIMYVWALWEHLFTQNTEEYFMLSTVGRFIYTKYWGILYVEHCRKIYLHKILGITSCWPLWEYL